MSILSGPRLRIMLSLAPILVNRAAKKSDRLRQLLASAPGPIQFVAGKRPVGFYTVRAGALRWKGGAHPKPSFTQVWKTPESAFRELIGKDEPDIVGAFLAEQLKLFGNFQSGLWFGEVMAIAKSTQAAPQH
ncbi:MAG: hypothetical protein WBX25_11225 [Rhodomicrobium sp.]